MAGDENKPTDAVAPVAAVADDEVGKPTQYVATLPMEVKQRLKALRKMQVDYFKINGQFYKEAAELESKFFSQYNQLFDKRATIVSGSYEPTAEDCEYKECNEGMAEELATVVESEKPVTGVPSFWLTCLKNSHDGTNDFIIEADEPILEHLTDIAIEDHVDSFKLVFHFSANDYFTNATLTKEFKLKLAPTEDDPFNFEGPEIIAMLGCKIDWKADKDVTQRKVTKKQKNKKTGTTRMITKLVQTDSFFNFFNHHESWIEETEGMDELLNDAFHSDTNLGSFFRERLIPRAVLYFTGELANYGDEYDEELDEDVGDMDEDADSDADPDYKPTKKALRRGQQAPECKQQ